MRRLMLAVLSPPLMPAMHAGKFASANLASVDVEVAS